MPDEDEFMLTVVEAGGDDYDDAVDEWIVYTGSTELAAVRDALTGQGLEIKGYELIMEPTTPTVVTVEQAKKVMKLVDKLEDLEDIQNVFHSMNITDEIAEALGD
jgi:transcriptional/translational regulatory protein YebC/TACO1